MAMNSLSQRSAEVRTRRAQLKREVKAGEVHVSELLAATAGDVPDWLENFAIAHLLSAMPRVSFEMGCGLCEALRIPPLKPIGKMTYRQRREVADHVAEWESTVPSGGKRGVIKGSTKGPYLKAQRIA
jgi:hypothetical protein